MNVADYYGNGKTWWLRLHEKGGKRHEVPCHHNLATYLDAWSASLVAGGLAAPGGELSEVSAAARAFGAAALDDESGDDAVEDRLVEVAASHE